LRTGTICGTANVTYIPSAIRRFGDQKR